MFVNTAKKQKIIVAESADILPMGEAVSAATPHLPMAFTECRAAYEKRTAGFNEVELRKRIENATDRHLDNHLCDYLKGLIQQKTFFFVLKGLAIKLPGDVERRWRHYDKSQEEEAHALRALILSLLKPFLDCAPPRMKLRVRIQLWNEPQPVPRHNTAPAYGIAIDAVTGDIHRRFYGTNIHVIPQVPFIPCGLTALIQPFRHGDEAWTQEQGQGGYMYSEEQTLGVNERTERALAQVSPKPRPA